MSTAYTPKDLRLYWVPLDADGDPEPPVELSRDSALAGVTISGQHISRPQRLAGLDHVVVPELRNAVGVQAPRVLFTEAARAIVAGPGMLAVANLASGRSAVVPMLMPDPVEGLLPLALPRADAASVNLRLGSRAPASWGAANVELPVAQGDAQTFAVAEGADLWQLFPAQTASTWHRAGASQNVPAAGVSVLTEINAATSVYGAADGLVVAAGLTDRVGSVAAANDVVEPDPVFKVGPVGGTLAQLGVEEGVADIAVSLGRGFTARPDLTVLANGFAAGQVAFSVDDTAITAPLLWPTVFAAGGLYALEIGPLGSAAGQPRIRGTARLTSVYATGPQTLRYRVQMVRTGPVTVDTYS